MTGYLEYGNPWAKIEHCTKKPDDKNTNLLSSVSSCPLHSSDMPKLLCVVDTVSSLEIHGPDFLMGTIRFSRDLDEVTELYCLDSRFNPQMAAYWNTDFCLNKPPPFPVYSLLICFFQSLAFLFLPLPLHPPLELHSMYRTE